MERMKGRWATIALAEEHRVLLHAMAAQRGWRGYSRVLAEIIDFYLLRSPEARGMLERLPKKARERENKKK